MKPKAGTSTLRYCVKKLSLCSMRLHNLKWYLPCNVIRTVYHALAVPVINYGVSVWGLASETNIKSAKLQNRCVRAFSNCDISENDLYSTFRLLRIDKLLCLHC